MRAQAAGLPGALAHEARRIQGLARAAGLDFEAIDFRLLDAREVNAVAAYGGFPTRYPSWRFGMEFERLDKAHQYGLSRIYELVINTEPVVAYLVRTNSHLEQKLVMAHVCGHADFFKHNAWFAATDRGMLARMGEHAQLVRDTMEREGQDTVETFLDRALSLETLIDPYLPLRSRLGADVHGAVHAPTFDVLGFLVQHAPLAPWQRDLLALVRREATYFQPQRMTKIMNEGWASFWHARLLTGGVLADSEIVDFADCHSGATAEAPGRVNPYKLGIELFRTAWDQGLDVFRLRRVHNDASLIDLLVDEAFVVRQKLFLYGTNAKSGRTEVVERDPRRVKAKLMQDLSWGGLPRIELVAASSSRGLELVHRHDGRDLDLGAARATLLCVEQLWGAPVELTTLESGEPRRIVASRGETTVQEIEAA
ncbi:MAG TPA: SpoVR family protein [Planctomycetota bacterium]|nr:SpoVR family protein [Planctomycetota bacterium]